MRRPLRRAGATRPPLAPRAGEPPRRRRGLWLRAARPRAGAVPVAGLDVSAQPPRRRLRLRTSTRVALAAGAVCAALLLVALRVDAIRLRYRLAEAVAAEERLRDEQRRLTVERRHLRHPLRLEAIGRELGLARPACVVDLAAPAAAARCLGATP